MKLKLFMPTTSIAGGLFMLKRTKREGESVDSPSLCHHSESMPRSMDFLFKEFEPFSAGLHWRVSCRRFAG